MIISDNIFKRANSFNQIEKIDSHILGGVTYLQIMLYIAGILMVVFLVWGLISTMMTNFKKAMPSLVFVGIAILAFIYAYANTGSDPSEDVRLSNFWVNGLMFVLVPGAIFLVVDLVIGIVKGYTK